MENKQKMRRGSVFALEGIPPAGQLVPLGLQHVVGAVVGIITPAIMVSDTCGLPEGERTLLIQVSLVVTAIATLTQLYTVIPREPLIKSCQAARRDLISGSLTISSISGQ